MFGYKLVQEEEILTDKQKIEALEKEIEEAMLFVQQLRKDSTKATYKGDFIKPNSLISNLVKMQEEIQDLEEDKKNQIWVTTGLAKFSEILRNNFDTQRQMGDEILAQIIPYINAVQGGLFLIQEEEEKYTTLELIACYAYNRKKFIQKTVRIENDYAEGLVGQVFLEKKEFYLTQIPQDYLKITSGLGEANPNYIFICPLLDGQEVIGVLEIASFRAFEPHHQDFIKKLCESLASTVISTRINERTRSLLQATREQTEELMAQDEELRQNMEELQTTQEEMQRILQEQANTMAAIDSASISADFSIDGKILRVNEAFIEFFGYSEKELMGQHHSLLVHPSMRESQEYTNLWKKLGSGVNITSDFQRFTKSQEIKWLRATYYPIRGTKGEIVKVLKIAYDITLEKEQEMQLIENQQLLEQNRILLKERTKSIQDKAYERIKALKAQLAEKEKIIETLSQPNTID